MAISVNVTETVIDTDVTNTDVTVALTEQTTNVELTYPGPQGASAIVNVTTPITNTGTTTEPNIGIDQTLLSLARTQIVGTAVTEAAGKALTAGTADYATLAGTSVYATNAGTSVYATNAGTSVYATNAGTAVSISGSILKTQVTGTAVTLADTGTVTNAMLAGAISATNVAGTAYTFTDFYQQNFATAGTIETVPRVYGLTNSGVITNNNVFLTYFTPITTTTISSITVVCNTGGTDSGGTTVRRFGIYTITGTRTYSLVARVASDATIGNTSNTAYTRNLDTTGGYPSTYTLNAGTTYAFGIIAYNTGGTYNGPAFVISTTGQSTVSTLAPRMTDVLTGQTDLPSSITGNANTGLRFYARLL